MSETRTRRKTNAELEQEIANLRSSLGSVATEIKDFTENYEAGCESGRIRFVQELGAHLKAAIGYEDLSALAQPEEQAFNVTITYMVDPGYEEITSIEVEDALRYGIENWCLDGVDPSTLVISVTEQDVS